MNIRECLVKVTDQDRQMRRGRGEGDRDGLVADAFFVVQFILHGIQQIDDPAGIALDNLPVAVEHNISAGTVKQLYTEVIFQGGNGTAQ